MASHSSYLKERWKYEEFPACHIHANEFLFRRELYHWPDFKCLYTAQGKEGIQAEIELRYAISSTSGIIEGELLAVHDTHFFIFWGTRVTRVHFWQIQEARFNQLSQVVFRNGRAPELNARNKLRLLSRYPQGLSGALLERVLQSVQQEAVYEVE